MDTQHLEQRLPIVEALAAKALEMAVDASPTKPRAGEHVRSLMEWVPVAKGLLAGESVGVDYRPTMDAAVAQRRVRFVDGLGHDRPHYLALATGLHRAGQRLHRDSLARSAAAAAGMFFHFDDPAGFEHTLLAAAVLDDPGVARDYLKLGLLDADQALHPLDTDTSPDEWTFAELAGLHGLFNTAVRLNDPEYLSQAGAAARYHLQHTQPDYTTYQPWALAAFLYFPDTVGFAEQQLHDVETHLNIEGPPGALVPGLLLADAYATLKHTLESQASESQG